LAQGGRGSNSDVILETMKKRQEAMKDKGSAAMMQKETVRMMVVDKMAHQMAADSAFQKMHADMMKDPACIEMMKECKLMMGDDAQMKKIEEEIHNDAKAMEMVMSKAMIMDMAR